MDRITEAIAHFIGLFEITIEEARLRDAYEDFRAKKAADLERPDLAIAATPFMAPYQLLGYEPGFAYRAPPQPIVQIDPQVIFPFDPPKIPLGDINDIATPIGFSFANVTHAASHRIHLPEIEPAGSVVNYFHQGISLSDNDYFGVGGHGLLFTPQPVDDTQIAKLASEALEISPLDGLDIPGSAEEVAAFVEDVAERLDAFSEGENAEFLVEESTEITGSYVNGKKVSEDEVPNIEDYHDFNEEAEEGGTGNTTLVDGEVVIEASVTVETGGNTLVNNAVLKSFWTGAPVTAVMGKHLEINAIIQINAWCDSDYVTSAVGGWINQGAPTETFNIATFERFDDFGEESAPAAAQPDFPEHWVVTEIHGDLMIMSWLEQFTFMSDNDIGILSSSGVTSRIYSGDNGAYNNVSLEEIGFGYDLIIIGGNIYDANIIQQLNILCDNDLIGAVDGFETTGNGSISTAGNLLWNQAYIYNVGGTDRFEAMPDAYRETAAKIAAGEDYLSDGVLSDSAFAGYGALRVLYISGDLLNLQYIKQTNVLGDSDQLALAMNAVEAHPEANWSVTTGDNTLINNAAIMDLDSIGKTYVGGEQYSAEILIQADIFSTNPDLGGQDPDVLVNEAVAFLDDEMAGGGEAEHRPSSQGETDYLHSDGMQSMLG